MTDKASQPPTQAEFISTWMKNAELPQEARLANGVQLESGRVLALPCACDEADCEGWRMVQLDDLHEHLFLRAPEPLRRLYREAVGSQ